MFKFEFFFKPKERFHAEVIEETTRAYPNWRDSSVSILRQLRDRPPRFAHAILRSIAEAYYVVATGLNDQGDLPVSDRSEFIDKLMDLGCEMLLRRKVSGESSLSRDLYAAGLRLADHRVLTAPQAEDLCERRSEFLQETYQVLLAINLLQGCYDKAWLNP